MTLDEAIKKEENIEIAEMLKEYKILKEKTSWVDYSEYSPEETDMYLVAWKFKGRDPEGFHYYHLLQYDAEKGEWDTIAPAKHKGFEIFAWMPLPDYFKFWEMS